jgi:glutathionyl-hydroquinone reductase
MLQQKTTLPTTRTGSSRTSSFPFSFSFSSSSSRYKLLTPFSCPAAGYKLFFRRTLDLMNQLGQRVRLRPLTHLNF